MRNNVLTAILALTLSTAAACSVKPGYVLNGMTRIPAGLTSTCGFYYTAYRGGMLKGMSRVKWVELYMADGGKGKDIGVKVGMALGLHGFKLIKDQPNDNNGRDMGFRNVDSGKVIVVQVFVIDDIAFLGAGGN